jgi:hypothetical protein
MRRMIGGLAARPQCGLHRVSLRQGLLFYLRRWVVQSCGQQSRSMFITRRNFKVE